MAPDRHGRAQRVSVLFDANALMMPAQFSIDPFDDLRGLLGSFEPLVLESVLDELAGLSAGRGKDGAAARFGIELARRCTTVRADLPSPCTVDEQVIAYAADNGCLVLTNDRNLRQRLLERGIGVISMRKQKRLELIHR